LNQLRDAVCEPAAVGAGGEGEREGESAAERGKSQKTWTYFGYFTNCGTGAADYKGEGKR